VRTVFAGGIVDLSGVGYLNELSMEKLYLSASLSNIKVRPLERGSVAFDGKLYYEMSPEVSYFNGNIDIKKAKYEKDLELARLIVGFKEIDSKKAAYPDFLKNAKLNIHIEGQDDILIDNNIATTPVKISLNIMGTIEQYGLIGKVEALRGVIYFRNNEFTILEGSRVEFVDPDGIEPVFHIVAESYLSDYYVKLTLDGTMDQFNLSLFSDPPLSETDVLTLLTFGQFRKGTKGFESGLAASEAASMLTGDIQEAVGSKFKNITGFERFQVEPHTTAGGSFTPKITVGKRLIKDKLMVLYSTSVGTTEENIIKLQYNLRKNVSIVGSRNEIGSAGVGLKYRFEFK
jgi:translocation and assembly module TamB